MEINSIKREIQEEAGYKAEEWDKLGTLVNAPGYSDEVIHLFLARKLHKLDICLLYTSPSPRDRSISRMPSSA